MSKSILKVRDALRYFNEDRVKILQVNKTYLNTAVKSMEILEAILEMEELTNEFTPTSKREKDLCNNGYNKAVNLIRQGAERFLND